MSSLIERMKKVGIIKEASILSESQFFNKKDDTPTEIPIINVALSATIDGGLTSGLTFLAGPSKHFKSLLGLILVKSYMKKYEGSVCIFYDSEFGVTPEYVSANGIDASRVLHLPVKNLEELKFDISTRLEEIKRGDKIIIFIDSIGNMASKKEGDDAREEKSVADMSRAKSFKSLWRIVTPHLTIKDIPCVAINHVYSEMSLYPKSIMSGGCVVAGTKIIMGDGSLKSIEDVIEGDEVKTLSGNKNVKYTWNPETLMEGTPECFEVEFDDGHKVICSENHKFMVNDEWVELKDIQEGSNVSKITLAF